MAEVDFAKNDAWNINENIDSVGWISELPHSVIIKEAFFGDVGLMSEIFIDYFDESLGIIGGLFDEKIDIPGISWVAMRDHSVAAYDDELNAMGLQQFYKLSELLIRYHRF